MLANLTLADAQLQIGATIVLLIAAYGLGWFSARAKDWLQRELLEAGIDLPPAQMTPFRGPLECATNSNVVAAVRSRESRAVIVERLLADIANECEAVFVDPADMSPEWRDLTRRIRELSAPAAGAIYTEHSPQIVTGGPYGDRWREVED